MASCAAAATRLAAANMSAGSSDGMSCLGSSCGASGEPSAELDHLVAEQALVADARDGVGADARRLLLLDGRG